MGTTLLKGLLPVGPRGLLPLRISPTRSPQPTDIYRAPIRRLLITSGARDRERKPKGPVLKEVQVVSTSYSKTGSSPSFSGKLIIMTMSLNGHVEGAQV